MSDDEFLSSFESGSLTEFRHRDHIRMTWLYLRRDGPTVGAQRIADGIKRFAHAQGAPAKYNETLTRFWIRLVAAAIATGGCGDRFEDFCRAHPELFDKDRALSFYRRETLSSPTAKTQWIEPDLRPLP